MRWELVERTFSPAGETGATPLRRRAILSYLNFDAHTPQKDRESLDHTSRPSLNSLWQAPSIGLDRHGHNAQTALQRGYAPDVLLNVDLPDLLLSRRRFSICCKAPVEKTTSKSFSASRRFRSQISLRGLDSRGFSSTASWPSSAHALFLGNRYKVCLATTEFLTQVFEVCAVFETLGRHSLERLWMTPHFPFIHCGEPTLLQRV